MWSKTFRSLAFSGIVALLAVSLTTGCQTKKPQPDDASVAAGAEAGVDGTPTVVDKELVTDPLGSDSGRIEGLNTVYFEFDQARLTAEARRTLAENAEWIKNHPGLTIQIEGHTDSRGSIEYNLALGERRAKSVKTYLETLGVDPKRLTIISYGKEKPIAHGENEEAWAKNRRANFVPLQ